MAKNLKKNKGTETNGNGPGAPNDQPQSAPRSITRPKQARPNPLPVAGDAAPASSTPTAAKPARATSRKTATGEKPRKTAPPKKSALSQESASRARASSSEISEDEIRLRAYFISEWRTRNGIEGNSDADWREARRQLESEAANRA